MVALANMSLIDSKEFWHSGVQTRTRTLATEDTMFVYLVTEKLKRGFDQDVFLQLTTMTLLSRI